MVAGTVAMSTSPVITLAVLHETRPRGQVTERLLLIHHEDSVFSARIRASINDVTAQLAGA